MRAKWRAITCARNTAAMPVDCGGCAGRGQGRISRHGSHRGYACCRAL